MSTRPYVLAETPWKSVKENRYEVAVLPWGATEAHNTHLPYGSDMAHVTFVAERSAGVAWENGARVVALPTVPFGVNTGQLDIPMHINMNPSTQMAVLRDVAEPLPRHGVKKLVVLNGHGGNDFKQMIRELQPQCPDLFLCQVNWWQVVDESKYFDEPGDHAGEMETSVLMAIAPELVLPLSEAGTGEEHRFKIPGLRNRWAWAPRQWSQATDDTGVGNPARATAEKGERYLSDTCAKIGEFLADLAKSDITDLYG